MRVSRSGYYEWKKTREERERRAGDYAERVRRVFEESGGVYGADRICGTLRSRGYGASFRKVRECMSSQGLRSIHMRRRQRSLTNSSASRGEGYANLVRGMEIDRPFQVISSDISYIRTDEGFAYLCQIRDVASGMILAAGMSDHMKAELVLDTIRKVVLSWDIPEGCIFHSDRGSQYASEKVMKYLGKRRIRQSFSRVGTPGDNSWSESFFSVLKKESVHWVHFHAREEARQAMFGYIEGFYNTKRVQKRLGYLSPSQWLKEWYHRNSVGVA